MGGGRGPDGAGRAAARRRGVRVPAVRRAAAGRADGGGCRRGRRVRRPGPLGRDDRPGRGRRLVQQVGGGEALRPAGGPFLVGLVGVVLVAAGGYAVVHGVRRDFLRDLALPPRFRTLVTVLGTVGWTALGVAGGAAGGLLVAAAVQFDLGSRRPRRRDPDIGRSAVRTGPAARAGRRAGGLRRLLLVRRAVPHGGRSSVAWCRAG